jgi:hypothetical protein
VLDWAAPDDDGEDRTDAQAFQEGSEPSKSRTDPQRKTAFSWPRGSIVGPEAHTNTKSARELTVQHGTRTVRRLVAP